MGKIYFYKEDNEDILPYINIKYTLNGNLFNGNFILDIGSNITTYFSDNSEKKIKIFIKSIEGYDIETEYTIFVQKSIFKNKNNIIKIDGLIGLSILSKYCLKINFNRNEFYLNKEYNIAKYNKVNSYFDDNYLIVNLNINDEEFNLLYDTGSSKDVILFEGRTKNISYQNKFDGLKASGQLGNEYSIIPLEKVVKIDFFKIGVFETKINIMLKHPMINNIPLEINGIIGNQFFRHKEIIIDYPNKKLLVKK